LHAVWRLHARVSIAPWRRHRRRDPLGARGDELLCDGVTVTDLERESDLARNPSPGLDLVDELGLGLVEQLKRFARPASNTTTFPRSVLQSAICRSPRASR